MKQLVSDLEESRDSSGPSTRIYFTKESKIICLLNIVMLCGLPTKGVGEFPAATLFSNFGNTDYDELDCKRTNIKLINWNCRLDSNHI